MKTATLPVIMTILQTERLTIRRWQPDDWRLLIPMHNDPDVMRYLGGELLTDDQIQEFATRQQQEFQVHTYCYWPIELNSTCEVIGLCGIQHKDDDYYDFGWRLAKQHWNLGYTTEAALAIRDYAFETLNLPILTSTANAKNVPSINVMKKVGMTYIRNFMTVYGDCVRYELSNPNQD